MFKQLVISFGLLLSAGPAYPHGGGLNHCGCHFNRKTGECHCHRDYGCGCACQPAHCGAGKDKSEPLLPWKEAACQDETSSVIIPAGGHGGGRGGSYRGSSTSVRGYTRKNGTYVAPHHRSAPDRSKTNNWNTKGNVNPYTSKEGTKAL